MKEIQLPPLGQLHEMSKDDLRHIQDSIIDAVTGVAQAVLPAQFNESDHILRLSGFAITADTLAVANTEGWVYYNGKVYYVEPGIVNPGEGTAEDNKAETYLEIIDVGSDAAYQDSAPFRVFADFRMQLVVGDDDGRVPLSAVIDHIIQGVRGEVRSVVLLSGQTAETDVFAAATGLGVGSWTGWAVADGRNGTPNLNGRALVGSGLQADLDVGDTAVEYAPGQKFGKNRIQLSSSESGMPQHTVPKVLVEDVDGDTTVASNNFTDGSNGHVVNRKVNGTNAAESHYNVQPSFAVILMVKL